jgi:hypothetical protein
MADQKSLGEDKIFLKYPITKCLTAVGEKWSKDRKSRKLSYDDIQPYRKIVVALNETIRLMAKIDALIPSWPIA